MRQLRWDESRRSSRNEDYSRQLHLRSGEGVPAAFDRIRGCRGWKVAACGALSYLLWTEPSLDRATELSWNQERKWERNETDLLILDDVLLLRHIPFDLEGHFLEMNERRGGKKR